MGRFPGHERSGGYADVTPTTDSELRKPDVWSLRPCRVTRSCRRPRGPAGTARRPPRTGTATLRERSTGCPHRVHNRSTACHTKPQHLVGGGTIGPPYLVVLALTDGLGRPTLMALTDASTGADSGP